MLGVGFTELVHIQLLHSLVWVIISSHAIFEPANEMPQNSISAPASLVTNCRLGHMTCKFAACSMATLCGVNAVAVSLQFRDRCVQLTTDTSACIVKRPSSSSAGYGRSSTELLAAPFVV